MRSLFLVSCALALVACGGSAPVNTGGYTPQLRVGGEATNHCEPGPLKAGEHVTIFGFSGTDAIAHQLQPGSPTYVTVPRSCLTPLN